MDREKNARREAKRLGLVLRKSRADGTWMVIEPAPTTRNLETLGRVEEVLAAYRKAGWGAEHAGYGPDVADVSDVTA